MVTGDDGRRLVQNLRDVARNGLAAAFDALERRWPPLLAHDRQPQPGTLDAAALRRMRAPERLQHFGHLGRVDAAGLLTICGRVKNVIVTANGKNVYPEEVENELLHSPYIAEAMVYGHKAAGAAEEVYAIIYPHQEAIDGYAHDHGRAPLSEQQVEELIRDEVLKAGRAAGMNPLTVAVVAAAASVVPALRATRVDPAAALRA